MTTFIGIDPGKSGAIVVDSGLKPTPAATKGWFVCDEGKRQIEVYPMPLIGNELDVRGIGEIFADLARTGHTSDCFAMLEKQQCYPKQGGVSNFSTGYGYGVLVALLTAHCIPLEEVRPATWKKAFGLSMRGEEKAAKKAASIQKAQQLYPGVNLVMPGCRKLHDGVAEALLIMEHGKRMKGAGK